MKEKQGNKPNSYGKLMKRMLIYLGIGGVCGFFVGIFMTFGVKNGMSDLSDLVRPLALPIIAVIFVVSIVLMEFYSRKLKDTMKHLEEAEDEQYEVLSYEEEKYGAMLMSCNVISQVCDIIVLTFTFSRSWLEEASGKELGGYCLSSLFSRMPHPRRTCRLSLPSRRNDTLAFISYCNL